MEAPSQRSFPEITFAHGCPATLRHGHNKASTRGLLPPVLPLPAGACGLGWNQRPRKGSESTPRLPSPLRGETVMHPVLAVHALPGPHEPAGLLSCNYRPLRQVHQQRVPNERLVSDSKTKDPGNCQVKDPQSPRPPALSDGKAVSRDRKGTACGHLRSCLGDAGTATQVSHCVGSVLGFQGEGVFTSLSMNQQLSCTALPAPPECGWIALGGTRAPHPSAPTSSSGPRPRPLEGQTSCCDQPRLKRHGSRTRA